MYKSKYKNYDDVASEKDKRKKRYTHIPLKNQSIKSIKNINPNNNAMRPWTSEEESSFVIPKKYVIQYVWMWYDHVIDSDASNWIWIKFSAPKILRKIWNNRLTDRMREEKYVKIDGKI